MVYRVLSRSGESFIIIIIIIIVVVVVVVVSGARALGHSVAPLLSKFGSLSSQEIWVVT